MSESFLKDRVTLHCGDCVEVLKSLPENSVDACVADPPYHLTSIVERFGAKNAKPAISQSQRRWSEAGANLGEMLPDGTPKPDQYGRLSKGFMGKVWDGGDVAFRPETWVAVYRVLKPGAHLLAFGGTRTYHRLACAIEDAGFEIRDCVLWLYGSGFPKSHDVSKGIDKAEGFWRGRAIGEPFATSPAKGFEYERADKGEPITDTARRWEGWGTALKPAVEMIVLARKPLSEGTVAANVLKWGTGAINVDGCRIGTSKNVPASPARLANGNALSGSVDGSLRRCTGEEDGFNPNIGRWPANVIHDGSEEVVAGFPDLHGAGSARDGSDAPREIIKNMFGVSQNTGDMHRFGDSGSAARFFYTSKANADDRLGSKHPTVKPLDLMQYLCRLVTPPKGTIIDPFAGTGTTGEAAFREGFNAILIEREEEYQHDIRRRMELVLVGPDERARESIKARGLTESPGPLFDALDS